MPRDNNRNTNNQGNTPELPEFVFPFVETFQTFYSEYQALNGVWHDEGCSAFEKAYVTPLQTTSRDFALALLKYHDVMQQVNEASKELLSPFAGTNGISFLNLRMVWNRLPRRIMDKFSGGWRG